MRTYVVCVRGRIGRGVSVREEWKSEKGIIFDTARYGLYDGTSKDTRSTRPPRAAPVSHSQTEPVHHF